MLADASPLPQDVCDDLARLRQTVPAFWIEDHCKIVSKSGELIPLAYNESQCHTDRIIGEMELAKMPVRVIHLKARQLGETTRGCARIYNNACTLTNRRCLISAHDSDSSINIFRKIQLFQECNPEKIAHKYSSRKELTFSSANNSSSILVETAGKEKLGRGSTFDDFHGSEVAFWDNAGTTMLSVNQCIPGMPGTMSILESTANGVGGYFYETYRKAKKAKCDIDNKAMVIPEPDKQDWNGYYRVFNPWFVCSEYRSVVPSDFVRSRDEQLLVDRYGLDNEQLQWRRKVISSECNGDGDLFRQEYPSDDSEAFLVSGRGVFDSFIIKSMVDNCRPAKHIGQMGGPQECPEFDEYNMKWLEVWQLPSVNKDDIYAIGVDTSEGLDPEQSNNPDAHSAHVIHVNSARVVAKISGRFDPDIFGEQLDLLGRWYNCALLGVEVNNTSGGSVRSILKRLCYPNLYYREILTKEINTETDTIGWYTDKVSRGILVTDGTKMVRERSLYIPSIQTIYQMQQWIFDKNGRATHTVGEHDDDVISLLISWQMAAIATIVGARQIVDTTGEYADGSNSDGVRFTSDMVVGGHESPMSYLDE